MWTRRNKTKTSSDLYSRDGIHGSIRNGSSLICTCHPSAYARVIHMHAAPANRASYSGIYSRVTPGSAMCVKTCRSTGGAHEGWRIGVCIDHAIYTYSPAVPGRIHPNTTYHESVYLKRGNCPKCLELGDDSRTYLQHHLRVTYRASRGIKRRAILS